MSVRQRLRDRPTGNCVLIAHRGASDEAPENTLAAFRSAIQQGAKWIELDYHHSADQVPVVLHDETLDRTTDASLKLGGTSIRVATTSLQRLRTLDAGAWYSDRFRDEPLPTVDEALDIILPAATPVIERKAGDAKTLWNLLNGRNQIDQVVVMSFDWEFVRQCRSLASELFLVALGDNECTAERLHDARRTGCDLVGWNHRYLTRGAVDRAAELGLGVWTYTVDDPDRARELVDWGVRGVITNGPAALRFGGRLDVDPHLLGG